MANISILGPPRMGRVVKTEAQVKQELLEQAALEDSDATLEEKVVADKSVPKPAVRSKKTTWTGLGGTVMSGRIAMPTVGGLELDSDGNYVLRNVETVEGLWEKVTLAKDLALGGRLDTKTNWIEGVQGDPGDPEILQYQQLRAQGFKLPPLRAMYWFMIASMHFSTGGKSLVAKGLQNLLSKSIMTHWGAHCSTDIIYEAGGNGWYTDNVWPKNHPLYHHEHDSFIYHHKSTVLTRGNMGSSICRHLFGDADDFRADKILKFVTQCPRSAVRVYVVEPQDDCLSATSIRCGNGADLYFDLRTEYRGQLQSLLLKAEPEDFIPRKEKLVIV